MNPDSLPSEMVLVPRTATTAMLRPFYECPPDELQLAWQAAMLIAERTAPQGAQPAEPVAWRPMKSAPTDGTIVRLLVDYTAPDACHPLEDAEVTHTIGGNTDGHTGLSEGWKFAGWSWEQDCFTEGKGKPIGWLPFDAASPADAAPVPQALAGPLEQPQEPTSDKAYLAQASGGEDLQTALPRWEPIATAPKDGTPFMAWYPKVKLDDDDNATDEVVGGAAAIIQVQGDSWDEPEWLGAHGSYFFEDWCFAELPTHWMPLPLPPGESAGAVPSDKPAASSESSVSVPLPVAALSDAEILQIADKYAQLWRSPDEEGMNFEKSAFFEFARALLRHSEGKAE